MKISTVIVNYKRDKDTIECIRSIQKITLKKGWQLEIILVNNFYGKNNPDCFKKEFPYILVINNKKNTGFAQGNNTAIKMGLKRNADYFFLVNNDALVKSESLVYLIESAEKEQEIGLAGPKIYFAPGFEYHKQKYQKDSLGKVIWYAGGRIDWKNIYGIHIGVDDIDKGQYNKQKETEFISGCCMLVKRKVFEKIGLLDEKYFLYMEDLDFCIRAKRAGFRLIYQPKAIVWHKNLGTTKDLQNDAQSYFYTRNRLYLGFKYASFRTKTALFRESLKLLVKGSLWQKKGVVDFYSRKMEKGSYKELKK